MSTLDNEIALLRTVEEAGGLIVIEHGRYRGRKKHNNFSDNLARRLATEGLIEVESRTCSPWGFGPKVYYPGAAHPQSRAQYEADVVARNEFIARNPPQFQSRTDLAIRITEDGRDYLRRYG